MASGTMKASALLMVLVIASVRCLVSADDYSIDPQPLWKGITGAPWIHFSLDHDVSDEFDGEFLNETKWDPHGLRNENTNCPTWNGPTNAPLVDYSTYFTTTTQPFIGRPIPAEERQYRLSDGMLHLKISKQPQAYFLQREYYCNSTTYRCNYDINKPCYATKFNGDPILRDPNDPTSYRFINHDKCKNEPFCIPHPAHVVGDRRMYSTYVGPNLVGNKAFKYGFIEVNVRAARSSAVSAVWMYDNHVWPSYSRFRRDNSTAPIRLESPSLIRSRRWQEIDMLEVMNTWSQNLHRLYVPNIHVFAGYHGEFTRAHDDGRHTLGPIVLDESVFQVGRNPYFKRLNVSSANSWHLNAGAVHELKSEWADNFHRVGMYWSPYEIRFLIDGTEVLRIQNSLVHQSMFMVLSMAFNVHWAQTKPGREEIGSEFIVDYVRRWTVDLDVPHWRVPSSLPLSNHMTDSFHSLGNEYLAAENLFPVRDDNKTVELRLPGNSKPFWVEKHFANYVQRDIKRDTPSLKTSEKDIVAKVKERYSWVPELCTGKNGCGLGETGRKKKLTGCDRLAVEARYDRAREPNPKASYDPMNAVTAYEDADPNAAGAGWAL